MRGRARDGRRHGAGQSGYIYIVPAARSVAAPGQVGLHGTARAGYSRHPRRHPSRAFTTVPLEFGQVTGGRATFGGARIGIAPGFAPGACADADCRNTKTTRVNDRIHWFTRLYSRRIKEIYDGEPVPSCEGNPRAVERGTRTN
jgi:hypothetical protein